MRGPLYWKRAKVRAWAPTNSFYIRFTPNFGIGMPWFGGRRLRIAWHHGVQVVKWHNGRWYVEKQLLGRSRVRGEQYYGSVRNS